MSWWAPVMVAMWNPPPGRHVEPITKASFTDVSLPAFLEQDRKRNVDRRAWLCSWTLVVGGLLKISMWGFQETGAGGDSCARTWVQSDVGLFTQGPVKIPHFHFSTCLRDTLHPRCRLAAHPHNLPPAANDWGYWLPVHWAHQLDLVIINLWLNVDINLR